jgi:alpha,alpha-trehalose phosphorylase
MIHRAVVGPPESFVDDPWRIVERGFTEAGLGHMETIFSLSNGHLGLRGNVDETDPVHERGAYVNGFHETWPIRHPEEAFGFARTGQTIVALPDAKVIDLVVDEETLHLPSATLLSHERVLDMRAGTLERVLVWETRSGVQARVRSLRLVSFELRHLAVVRYEVTLLNRAAPVMIASRIAAAPAGTGAAGEAEDPRAARALDGRVLVPRGGEADGGRVMLAFTTERSGMRLVCGMDHEVAADEGFTIESGHDDVSGKVLMAFESGRGSSIRLTKLMTYYTSAWASLEQLRDRAGITLSRARRRGLGSVLDAQRAYLDEFWERGDVEVGGGPHVQQSVRWNLFQLIQAAGRADGKGVPAKGLTGGAYEGHYFWDIEAYVIPFLVYTNPRLAKNLLWFRHRMLGQAERRAREVNQRGALFPWRTINGEEASPYFEASTAQYHINADVMYALHKYVQVTGDRAFLHDCGVEMLVATARLWADLGFFSEGDGRFHIHGVTGPDEYTTVVNDNTFTNLMAQHNLRFAVESVEALRIDDPARHARLCRDTGLAPHELDTWRSAAETMFVPYDETRGINPQDANFLAKEVWDFAGTPPGRYPLLLHFHPLVIYRYQVLKQADVVMAMFLLADEFPPDLRRRNFLYYDPLTTGDSSLSACIESIVASQIGEADKALEYFRYSLFMDIGDPLGNAGHGVHVASAGGVWMALVYGFGGMRQRNGSLAFDPRLPAEWVDLRFRLTVHGQRLEVHITHSEVSYLLVVGDGLTVSHRGERLILSPGIPVSVPAEAGAAEAIPTEGATR